MKHIITTLALTLSISSASAVTVVNQSNKASPATVFAMAVKDSLSSDFYQASNCEDSIRVFNKTKDAVMIYNSSIEFAAREKGLNCLIKDAKAKVVFVGKQYMSVCTKEGNNPTSGKMGMASMYATKRHEQNYKSAGLDVEVVPYGGSKDIVAAVLAGDIAYGYIGSGLANRTKGLSCQFETNPASANFIGKTKKLEIPDHSITMVVYTNSDNPEAIAKQLKESDVFKTYLQKSGTVPTEMTIQEVDAYVTKMQKSWSMK